MAADEDEQFDVRGDGRIVLYKRSDLKKPKWQARIRVPNATGYKIVSTKTMDRDEAAHIARTLYEETYMHVRAGGTLQSRTFKQVFDEWKSQVAEGGTTRNNGSWHMTIARIGEYALTYFGPKRIDAIKESDFTAYWEWRKSNFSKKAPSDATLKRESACIMPVFRHAQSKGYISKLPATSVPKFKSERRPTFSPEEWKAIRDSSNGWVDEGHMLATWRDRFMAQHCFLTLANTGLRIGELRKLRWRDLMTVTQPGDDGQPRKYLAGHANGKTGPRQFVFQPGAEVSLKFVYQKSKNALIGWELMWFKIFPEGMRHLPFH